jgi:hypothetical protein
MRIEERRDENCNNCGSDMQTVAIIPSLEPSKKLHLCHGCAGIMVQLVINRYLRKQDAGFISSV